MVKGKSHWYESCEKLFHCGSIKTNFAFLPSNSKETFLWRHKQSSCKSFSVNRCVVTTLLYVAVLKGSVALLHLVALQIFKDMQQVSYKTIVPKRRKSSVTKKYFRIKFKIKPSLKHFFSSSFFSCCFYTKLHIRLELLKTMLHKTTASPKFIVFGNTDCFFFQEKSFKFSLEKILLGVHFD